jgi:hypothetical protein
VEQLDDRLLLSHPGRIPLTGHHVVAVGKHGPPLVYGHPIHVPTSTPHHGVLGGASRDSTGPRAPNKPAHPASSQTTAY